ncbi:hypothetical protein FACS1894147_00030 [Spirochaetia bacterium]|nr:hypothetical protein FACS1894147_00030 [Spirochaetia bacterium]
MITSNKLTAERLEAIKNFPITYDEDSPKLTQEQLGRMKPAYPEYWKDGPSKHDGNRHAGRRAKKGGGSGKEPKGVENSR